MTISANVLPGASLKPAILIVDDAPDQLGMLHSMMVQQGYQIFVATSGDRAMDIAQRVKPDLILLDVVMPGIDGLETCRRLKAHPATTRIPVIFMSARGDTEDIVAGFDTGAADSSVGALSIPAAAAAGVPGAGGVMLPATVGALAPPGPNHTTS